MKLNNLLFYALFLSEMAKGIYVFTYYIKKNNFYEKSLRRVLY